MGTPDRHAVLVTRRTRLQELIERHNTIEQARFYIEHLGASFDDYAAEHQRYQQAVREAHEQLARHARVQRLDRRFLANYLFAPDALVLVLGQDGLVANTLKYLAHGQPVIGVNPDPGRWDGVLLPFTTRELGRVVPEALAGKRKTRRVTMAQARLGDGQTLHAVNDLFIGPRTHTSARYEIRSGAQAEVQSSSGIIVSTGLGSTGWLQSLIAGAAGMLDGALADELQALRPGGFAWDARLLRFTVREPFPSRTTQAALVTGEVAPEAPLTLVSQMAGQGVIFSDGIESDYLEFNVGMRATITVAEREGCLVV